jgi:hypothetical protein
MYKMLSVKMLNAVMLYVAMPNAVMPNAASFLLTCPFLEWPIEDPGVRVIKLLPLSSIYASDFLQNRMPKTQMTATMPLLNRLRIYKIWL